jgi:hypothetical protein
MSDISRTSRSLVKGVLCIASCHKGHHLVNAMECGALSCLALCFLAGGVLLRYAICGGSRYVLATKL